MQEKLYNDYSSWVTEKFGARVQKISIDAGFTCPNRDGFKGNGGCIYCDNTTFSPQYCTPKKPVSQQLQEGISFFSKKYPAQKYLAYFQSYTNTYSSVEHLENIYTEALSHPAVIGLAISTRPDCISKEIVKMLKRICNHKFLSVEIGVESTSDKTLSLLNRCHSFEDSMNAIELLYSYKILIGVHLILGLPAETKEQMIRHAEILSDFPIHTLKLHQLQVIRGTVLESMYKSAPNTITTFTVNEYVDLCVEFLEHLNPEIIIERFTSESPLEKVILPNWGGLKNFEIVEKIRKKLISEKTYQGRLWKNQIS